MNKNAIIIVVIVLAIGLSIWGISEHTKRIKLEDDLDEKDKELEEKDKDYLKLLSQYLKDRKELPKDIREKLVRLKEEYNEIAPEIAKKLQVVIELLFDGKDEIAIEKLGLIVENLLKDKYKEEGLKKDNKGFPRFADLLKKAKELKWINPNHYFLSMFLKEKRNEEAHELTAKFSENDKIIAFLSGIEVIYQLKGVKRVA